jgi:hypothetical protein
MAKKQKTKLQKKRSNLVREKIIMQIFYWLLLLAPIVAFFIWKRDILFTTKNGLSVSLGAVLSLIIAISVVTHKSKWLKGVMPYVMAFLLSVLFACILEYLIYITGAVLIGYVLSVWFVAPIERRKKLILACDQAEINSLGLEATTIKVVTEEAQKTTEGV